MSDYDVALDLAGSTKDHFMFPSFAQRKLRVHLGIHPGENPEPLSGIRTGNSDVVSHAGHVYSGEASDDISTPGIRGHGEQAEDDTAVASRPSHQVDYLSHDWREEDIWSSWRYVVARREELCNGARLENASWRAWTKVKNDLKTIPPESLNWLKICDVTWLYGPLQSGYKAVHSTQMEPSRVSLSKNDSYMDFNKKSILKKRSLSEAMLQRALLTASSLKQATAAPKSHGAKGMLHNHLDHSITHYLSYSLSQRRLYGEGGNIVLLTESSSITTPTSKRKKVYFNEHVKQCIAVEAKSDDDDSDSNDAVMMKRIKTKRSLPPQKALKSKPAGRKTIAMLPSTTLKYWEDILEPREMTMGNSRNSIISFSSSHEILQPTAQSRKLLSGEDKDSLNDSLVRPSSCWSSLATEGAAGGILDRVIGTINTACDIAHIIGNAGWTK
ncbi:hypothetical protein BHE90_016284 [Fusarium euwallaceae]|uniref:Nitrogen regulatory protein areA GATA-like domain-containing protein n=2 Tax=Fusarium solani species complex TaxID=232080 RepID=A0A430L0T8_9HYPO|nr:hypothetical protein CEP51_015706 [Fusarium floridanum]RTE69334.1 hypothetical protein BHE90_016284 [Fusarium euwallaceae]